jgi:tetratricopeptide (TPR) repeat protein
VVSRGLKPLGSITIYYQFLDAKTISQIEDLMSNASNYFDFVLKLSDLVCLDDTPSLLTYLAAVHAWRLSANDAKEKLLQRFEDDPIIKSWTSAQHILGSDKLFAIIDEAIEKANENWLRIELLCLKSWYARYYFIDERVLTEPVDRAEALLKKDSEMGCFAALVHTVRSELGFMNGQHDQGYDMHNKGLEAAKKYDDQFQIYQLLWTCSSWIKTWDTKRALHLQEEAYRLAKGFGAPQKKAEAMSDMGRISEGLGEYDLAIKFYQNSVETYGSPPMELYREVIDSPTFGLSRIYCELGDGESGLEWIDRAIDIVGPRATELPYLFSQRAEALVILKRFEEAAQQLEICQKRALRSGGEGYVALCELGTGYLELAQGDPLTALKTFEPGYEFLSGGPAAIYINRFLLALTKAEIAVNLTVPTSERSERWMMLLEKHARERELPGIIMMHALLKTDYLLSQGLRDDAIDILKGSLKEEFSDITETLYNRVRNKLIQLQTSSRN